MLFGYRLNKWSVFLMSQPQNPRPGARDPRRRQRSDALLQLLANCPEHLFSTDSSEMASIAPASDLAGPATAADAGIGTTGINANIGLVKAA